MNYKVVSAMKTGEFEGKYGKLVKYMVQLEGQTDAVELNQKPDSPAPKAGDELEGSIQDTQYGKKFKKESAGYGGNGKSDPATQKAIIRQNALTNAVNYCVEKSKLMPQKDALKYLTGGEVIQVATFFARYSEGVMTVVSKDKEEPKEEIPEQQVDEEETMTANDNDIADDELEKAGL